MTNTRLAKLVYHTGSKLARIKTPQQTYALPNMEEVLNGEDPVVEKAERTWLPCNLSTKLLSWSMSLDPVHWDHWALEHKGCGASYCMDCKGYSCGDNK